MRIPEMVQKKVEAVNRRDAAAFAATYAPNAVAVDPFYDDPLRGEAIRKDIAAWFGALSDAVCRVTHGVIDGASHAGEWVVTGHTGGPLIGPDGEIPATGRSLNFRVATFERSDGDGRILEEHRYYGGLAIMRQPGLMAQEHASAG